MMTSVSKVQRLLSAPLCKFLIPMYNFFWHKSRFTAFRAPNKPVKPCCIGPIYEIR